MTGNPTRPGLLAVVLTLSLIVLPAAVPAQESEERPDPRELAREGAESMLRALEGLIMLIPQYEMPEITEDGDIIIRRKQPGRALEDEDDVPLGGPEVEETRT